MSCQRGATHHIDGVHWVEHSVQEDVVGGRLVRRCLVGVRCIAIRGPTWDAQTEDNQIKQPKQDTLGLKVMHTCTHYSSDQYSPSDLLARGEVKEDRTLHNVELALCRAADAGEGIIWALKLNKCLAEAGHHGDIAR